MIPSQFKEYNIMKNRKASAQNQKMIIAVVAIIIIAAAAYFLLKPAPEPTPQENKPPLAVATSTRYFAVVGPPRVQGIPMVTSRVSTGTSGMPILRLARPLPTYMIFQVTTSSA